MKRFILPIFALILFLGMVGAVECNIAGALDTNECFVSTTMTLSGGTHYMNDTDSNGAIRIAQNNLMLDGNNTILIGNETITTPKHVGINSGSKNNITIKNFVLYNYSDAMLLTGGYNYTLINITIVAYNYGLNFGTAQQNITISYLTIKHTPFAVYGTGLNTILITNSTFINNTNSIYIETSNNINVSNNLIINASRSDTYFSNGVNLDFFNNSIYGRKHTGDVQTMNNYTNVLFHQNYYENNTQYANWVSISNFSFYNNYIYNTTSAYNWWIVNASNGNIYNNSFILNDRAMFFEKGNSTAIRIYNNDFNNSYLHSDSFDTPIWIANDFNTTNRYSNFSVYNNRFNNFGCAGLLIRDMDDMTIYNNVFYQDFGFLLTKPFNCGGEPSVGIAIIEFYKGFIPVTYFPVGTYPSASYQNAKIHYSSNIRITGNTFNGVNVLIRVQGGRNISHDISSYKYSSWQPYYLTDRDEFFINPNDNNISAIPLNRKMTTMLYQGAFQNYTFNYSITSTYEYYKNINNFTTAIGKFNLSSDLVFTSNGTLPCGYLTTGDCNVTLQPNNYTYVLTDFSIVEGNLNENSPIQFSGSTTLNSKHLASSLNTNITADVSVNVERCDISTITYTPNGENTIIPTYTCDSTTKVLTLSAVTINPSAESNILEMTYYTDACVKSIALSDNINTLVPLAIAAIVSLFLLGAFTGMYKNLSGVQIMGVAFALVTFCIILGVGVIITSKIGAC